MKRPYLLLLLVILTACATDAGREESAVVKGLPDRLAVEVLGVHQGGAARARSIAVGVGRTNLPLVLVLSSYEPVVWDLDVNDDAQLLQVLVSGHHNSLVRGTKGAGVTRIGSAHTYQFGDAGYERLREAIRQHVGHPVDAFQGSYRGKLFSIGSYKARQVERPPLGLQSDTPALPIIMQADSQITSTWRRQDTKTQSPYDIHAFANSLYEVSVYTSEEPALALLVEAEVELVVARWLAEKLVKEPLPAGAPGSWDLLVKALGAAVEPVVAQSLIERDAALSSASLGGRLPFVREYERLIRTQVRRPRMQFTDPQPEHPLKPQTHDIPDILAFHERPAARKWRILWPELRAHAARLAAHHYRVDADPALVALSGDWNVRAKTYAHRHGVRLLSDDEWALLRGNRLGFTLSGLDRFLLPLGTEMREVSLSGHRLTIEERGSSVVMSDRIGFGLRFRIVDARWDKDIAKRLSDRELEEIDEALTATYTPDKGRWFAPLELEFNAYHEISRQLRSSREMQNVYQNFSVRADKAMTDVWENWR